MRTIRVYDPARDIGDQDCLVLGRSEDQFGVSTTEQFAVENAPTLTHAIYYFAYEPSIGDRVVLSATSPEMSSWENLTGRVADLPTFGDGSKTWVTLDDGQERPDGITGDFLWATEHLHPLADTKPDPWDETNQPVKDWALREAAEDLGRQLADARASIEALTNDLTRVRGEVHAARREHENDIAVIGDRLIAEADRRSWCSEYDEIIQGLNEVLHKSLPVREREYTVEVAVTRTIVYRTSMSVMATSEEHAEGIVTDLETVDLYGVDPWDETDEVTVEQVIEA